MQFKVALRSLLICILFITVLNSCAENENGVIIEEESPRFGIQPFGKVPDREIDSVKQAVQEMYGFDVVILDRVDLPDMAYTEIRYPRYRADSLVIWLADHKPDSVDKVLGLTNKDISITKYKPGSNKMEIKEPEWQYRDFGIYGLGRLNGKSCVVSSKRLHKNVNEEEFYVRLKRIACHEVGHTLGLTHCKTDRCLMHDLNENIRTLDNGTGVLCDGCWGKIE